MTFHTYHWRAAWIYGANISARGVFLYLGRWTFCLKREPRSDA